MWYLELGQHHVRVLALVRVPGHVELGGQVAEGLKLDGASLVIHGIVGEVHVASNVEVSEFCLIL